MTDKNLLKNVITHLVNGTLEQSLCRICLSPTNGNCENVFTRICKADKEYCIADILEKVCQIKISPSDDSVVCADCLVSASSAYKFYLTSQCSSEILLFYVNEIEKSLNSMEMPQENENICILLPLVDISMLTYDYDLEGISLKYQPDIPESQGGSEEYESDDSEQLAGSSGSRLSDDEESTSEKKPAPKQSPKKPYTKVEVRKKREPMPFISCTECSVKYRFLSKLRSHMKSCHGMDMYYCKICNKLIEGEEKFKKHSETHPDMYTCPICNIMFKRESKMRSHIRSHRGQAPLVLICVHCGDELPGEQALADHMTRKHEQIRNFTCYYCSKNYKSEIAFEAHLKKHEKFLEASEGTFPCSSCPLSFSSRRHLSRHARAEHDEHDEQRELDAHRAAHERYTCEQCNPKRSFVDARSLMWHTRLHTNERPYSCEMCDKTFVTLNRRNQHCKTAHSAPDKRCPLCPARFHLRSMVNTHIKKVHLSTNKRLYRSNRFAAAAPLPAVPPQELSVEIQHALLEQQIEAPDSLYSEETIIP